MLKRVSIQNFKSLKDVTLDLQKVNLLIGPNNSGKTNFLKALEIIGHDRQNRKHDVTKLSFAKDYNNKIEIKLFWPSDDDEFDSKIVKFYFDGSEIVDITGYYQNNDPTNVYKPNISIPEFKKSFLDTAKIYKIDSNKLTKPGPIGTREELVNSEVSNLVGFLDLMSIKYRRNVFEQIEKNLFTCIPEFDEIKLDDVDSTEELIILHGSDTKTKSFRKIGLSDSKQGITYWADELSEGTLYFLALLCIIHQPYPPNLLLLEEPEKGIHPRRIREVINFIRRLVFDKNIQVIMTTHSPLLLDEFAESPESVFVFDKNEEGATIVRNLQRDVIDPANRKNEEMGIPPVPFTEALGEYWTIGFLGGVPDETV